MSAQTVLITGGNGNLGRLVAERFERIGHRVVSFDLPGLAAGPAHRRQISGDIRDQAQLAALLDEERPGIIVHLASLLSGSSEADPAGAWEVNATASVALMQMAAARGIGPFVFSSTIASYSTGLPSPLPHDAPQWPSNVYGATKVAVERMGVWMKMAQGFDFRCLRFPMVISRASPPGAVTAYPGHAARAAAEGRPFTFPVARQTGMSTLFLDDVTRSLVEVAFAPRARLGAHAYNLHGFHFTAGALGDAIRARRPDAAFDYRPDPKVDALISGWPDALDDAPARADWGWSPRFDFAASCRALFDHVGL